MRGQRDIRRTAPKVVVLATVLLVALTWIGTLAAIRTQRAAALAHIETDATNKALLLEEQLRRQFLAIDQALRLIQLQWQRDPQGFDLESWSRQVVAANDIALQLILSDADGRAVASSRPSIVGTDVSMRDYFRHAAGLLADDGRMFVGSVFRGPVTQQLQFSLARRLSRPDGQFAGVISASYDIASLTRFYATLDVDAHGMIAVIGTPDGLVRAMTGGVEPGTNISGTPMFTSMTTVHEGLWVGPSAPDGRERIHAFHEVPGRGLTVVVGVERSEALRTASSWENGALVFSTSITLLLGLMGGMLVHEGRAALAREEELARDRIELAEANAHAQAKTAQLDTTLAGMSDGVMLVDGELKLLEWNAQFSEITGVPSAILRIGLPMAEILRAQARAGEFGPVDVEEEVARRMTLLRAGAAVGTIERQRPNGRWLELRRNPLAGGGFVTVYTDVTARHQSEERLRHAQMMASIGRLTSGVAHDFNNLLASILGNAELLERTLAADAKQQRRIGVIVNAAERGAALVKQLLAFSHKQSLAPSLVDLNAVVTDLTELLRTTLGAGIRIETQLGDALWPAVVDRVQVEHVLLNLAINARDAMPDGGVLSIATNNVVHREGADIMPGEYVVIWVSDTGTGMSETTLRNAFEPFFTTKGPGKGSGLGLSQVYGVATQSGGGVRIDSRLGSGTTVRVYFPRGTGVVDVPEVRPAEAAPPLAGTGRTVLLVDDDVHVRETVAEMLRDGGFDPVEAENGGQALRALKDGLRPDLLVVDFAMPDMNGIDVSRAAREIIPGLPVVLATGYRDEERIKGERFVILKPFVSKGLFGVIESAMKDSKIRALP